MSLSYESKLEFAPQLEVSGGFVYIGNKEFFSPRLRPYSSVRAFCHPIIDSDTEIERLVAHCYYFWPFHAIAEETTGIPRLIVRSVYWLAACRFWSNRRAVEILAGLRRDFGNPRGCLARLRSKLWQFVKGIQ
jgi:hypothetical protein